MFGILTIISLWALLVAVLELIACHVINSISDDALKSISVAADIIAQWEAEDRAPLEAAVAREQEASREA
jgi:hypothetical protein